MWTIQFPILPPENESQSIDYCLFRIGQVKQFAPQFGL